MNIKTEVVKPEEREFSHNPVRGKFEFTPEDTEFLEKCELSGESIVLAEAVNRGARLVLTLTPVGNVRIDVHVSEELDYVAVFDVGGACAALLASKTFQMSFLPKAVHPQLVREVDYANHEVLWRLVYPTAWGLLKSLENGHAA